MAKGEFISFFAFQVVKNFFGFQMHKKIKKQIYVNAAKSKICNELND